MMVLSTVIIFYGNKTNANQLNVHVDINRFHN